MHIDCAFDSGNIEVLAAEHMPERDQVTSGDGELIIDLPGPIEPREPE